MGSNGATELDPTIDFIAGALAGIAGLIVGHPFDTVKVRFQTPGIAHRYTSTFHAMATIAREEGVSGLFKGITSPLVSCAILSGVIFATYRFFIKAQMGGVEGIPTLVQIWMAGLGSGVVSSLIITPTELIKIRQQQSLEGFESTWAVVKRIWRREGGLRGLYRGYGVTLLRETGNGVYFMTYELSLRLLTHSPPLPIYAPEAPSDSQSTSWTTFLIMIAGALAGVVGWTLTFPFDVVKTRVQGSSNVPTASFPTTATSPLLGVKAGAVNPYRGTWRLSPSLIRAIPVNMVTFAVFEGIVQLAT